MGNSRLVDYVKISPNSSQRTKKIDKITIHHMAGNLSVETCGNVFQSRAREASSNYGIGTDGRVGLYVDESRRAWTSSNKENDNRAVTIEVANDKIGGDWHVSDKALATLIDLCADICQRNGIAQLRFTGDGTGNLTMHKMFAATACPGAYLESKFPYIAAEVNKRLAAAPTSKTVAELAKEVIAGKWGAGADRKRRLTAAGYDYEAVQAAVNAQLRPATQKKSVDEMAREVIAGKWGTGDTRKQKLTAAGYDYNAVQKRVNELLKG